MGLGLRRELRTGRAPVPGRAGLLTALATRRLSVRLLFALAAELTLVAVGVDRTQCRDRRLQRLDACGNTAVFATVGQHFKLPALLVMVRL